MKTKKIMMLFALAASLVVMACDMYDDGIPSKATRNEFKSMYPDARDVEWEREGSCWSVSFETGTRTDRVEHEAWFDSKGTWIMTETDVFIADVPQNIKDALSASQEYGSLALDDREVEYYQTPEGNFYRFDLIKDGADIEVDVTENGTVSPAKRMWL